MNLTQNQNDSLTHLSHAADRVDGSEHEHASTASYHIAYAYHRTLRATEIILRGGALCLFATPPDPSGLSQGQARSQ
eukprot:1359048-Prymnesium_polylepis.1